MEALLIIGKVAGIELCKCEIWVLGPVGGHIVVNELLHEVRAVYVPGPRSKLSSKATMVVGVVWWGGGMVGCDTNIHSTESEII